MHSWLYRVVIGNVVGVVEEPDSLDPARPLAEQYLVKIGALDRRLPLDKGDDQQVIARLHDFVTKHVAGREAPGA